MPIKITINKAAAGGADVEEVEEVQATVRLKAHKTLDGNILIKDHDMMDIILRYQKLMEVMFKKILGDTMTF